MTNDCCQGCDTMNEEWKEILEERLADARFLLDNNIDKIIAEAKKGRE